ncbi:hypothetical protein SAPIO_CDS0358 [Scedosporium apiospermum]|uniref:lytic cellulose monooxygenase (C4-dehydrogenating) n=1 Tax=Pseudallescheria apiosperma TaxID=563466 RepID=A0A084GGV0_PSEDA|nr:uncharacterized protein SAPIO_CDS0358 [Scedosporium apiospermum]KEZ46562.1 hypothetical protein SAPIO_CDS0358 [Scedosporium apiospermum]
MKFLSILAALAATAQAHYVFDKLIVNGQTTNQWQYVRATDNRQTTGPVTDVTSPTIRCYTSDTSVGSRTGTVNVAAGSTVGFTSSPAIFHPGPLSFYMAKAPTGTSASNFQGDGKVWFKIAETGPTITSSSLQWPSDGKSTLSVTIPRCIPDGDYLLRIEHIALHSASAVGGAQFYLSCAQIRVTGGGNTLPGSSSMTSFPGAYTATDPGVMLNIYWPVPQSYRVPGPSPWTC